MVKLLTRTVPRPEPKDESKVELPKDQAVTGKAAELNDQLCDLQDALLDEIDKRDTERDATRAEALKKQIEELRTELKAMIVGEKDSVRLDGAPPVAKDQLDTKGFSFPRAVIAIATKNWDGAELERDIFREMKKKADASSATALMTSPDHAGGFIVPENYSADIIEKLEQENILFQLGARLLPGIVGIPLILPKQTASMAAQWIPEGKTITRSRPTIGQIAFSPHTLAAMCQYSNLLMENANPAIESFLLQDIRQQFDNAINNTGFAGDGTDNTPVGIGEEAGVNTVDLTGGITYNKLWSFLIKLMQQNTYRGRLGWAMHPDFFQALVQITDATENVDPGGSDPVVPVNTQPLERRMLTAGPMTQLLGHPYRMTTGGLAATGFSVAFADWSQMLVPQWKVLTLRASSEAGDAFDTDTSLVRALTRMDMGLRHAEAFTRGENFGS